MEKLKKWLRWDSWQQICKEFRWIAGYARQYVWQMLWYVSVGLVSTVMGLAASVLGKNLIDTVTGQRMGQIPVIVTAYVILQLSGIAFSALNSQISARVRLKVGQHIRRDVFQKILNAQWEPLSDFHSGDLLTRCGQDVGTVAGSVIGWVPSLIINLVQFLCAFLLILYYDYTLAFLGLISAPVLLLSSVVLSRQIRKHSQRMQAIHSDMTAFHTEAFQNVQTIKSFHLVAAYGDKLKQLQKRQWDATMSHNRFSVLTSSSLALVGMAVSGLCFLWSVYRLWGGYISFGEMTMFLQLVGTLAGAFSALVGMVPSAITTATAAGRVMEVADLPPEEYVHQAEVEQILQSQACAVSLQVENMDFSYLPGNCVFRQVQIEAKPGQIVALVGPSGGGKTTMLRILLGIVQVRNGTATVTGGDPAVTLPISPSTRRLFAYVPQDNTLFSGTVAENLRLMRPDATEEQLQQVLELACALEFVSQLPQGIHTMLGERGNGLSEGQIQRLCIARALLTDAPVLLLDEATSALDGQTEQKILQNIVNAQKNRTCVVTTHRPSVLELSHRVYQIGEESVVCLR